VQERLEEMKREGKAHFADHCYLVGSALFTRAATGELDLSEEFLGCLKSIGKPKPALVLQPG